MDAVALVELCTRLLRAQAYRAGLSITKVLWGTEANAPDDGCDVWTESSEREDPWLGPRKTCWQLKAGKAGQASRLAGEISKPIPQRTLREGGRVVFITSGVVDGKKGESSRLVQLRREARTKRIPSAHIEVFDSVRLANWCNEHPAIAAYWAGLPEGLCTLEAWGKTVTHRAPWQSSERIQRALARARADLDFAAGTVHHLHIKGPPGVGKTRFALELCRGAGWSDAVIYIRQASDVRLTPLLQSIVVEPGVYLMVVVDEVQADQLLPLRDLVDASNGRIRLLTIGHCSSPDRNRVEMLEIEPMESAVVRAVVAGWHPSMPPEHVEFVTRFADGYVRLAWLAANAIAREPSLNAVRLLESSDVKVFLDKMLGTMDRVPLYVVASLTRVGWTGPRAPEGEAIAAHFNQSWQSVRLAVEAFQDQFGVAPRGGNYRYISPEPLALRLATEAWSRLPDFMESLPALLPTEEALDSYYERLRSTASNEHASRFAREQLRRFTNVDDFGNERAVRRWRALSAAAPQEAARRVALALADATIEQRTNLRNEARRQLVWALTGLAWSSSSFEDATRALALLAEAENETYANNASAEFVARFQPILGGTSVPYVDRLELLRNLLQLKRSAIIRLVVKALSAVASRSATRSSGESNTGELPEKEWIPNNQERFECLEQAMQLLAEVVATRVDGLQADLVDAAGKVAYLLSNASASELIAGLFAGIFAAYPGTREELRRIIANVIRRAKHSTQKLTPAASARLEALHASFEGTSLRERLVQHVGQAPRYAEKQPDISSLARELIAPDVLAEHWPWLTSGEAVNGWHFGEVVANVDSAGDLATILPTLPNWGADLRFLCGYIATVRLRRGVTWYDGWLSAQMLRRPDDLPLLFEIAWRSEATPTVVSLVTQALNSGQVEPRLVGRLAYGAWPLSLDPRTLAPLLNALVAAQHLPVAAELLDHRLSKLPAEAVHWTGLALRLATSEDLVRSEGVANLSWRNITQRLIPEHAGEIAKAIFGAHAHRTPEPWFLEFSEALNVVLACIKHDASAVWQSLESHLSGTELETGRFLIGLPDDLLCRMPEAEVIAWIGGKPQERAAVAVRIVGNDLSTDDKLAARVLGQFGEVEAVAGAFFSAYLSGMWEGRASKRWTALADKLSKIATSTKLPKLRRWALQSVRVLRQMAVDDQEQEDEDEFGRR